MSSHIGLNDIGFKRQQRNIFHYLRFPMYIESMTFPFLIGYLNVYYDIQRLYIKHNYLHLRVSNIPMIYW